MEMREFFNLIKNKKQTILIIVLFCFFLSLSIGFLQVLKYSSESRVLIVQNFPRGTDPYAISKSNEYVSTVLSKVIPSNSFYLDVMQSGFLIDQSYFTEEGSIRKEMEKWKETVEAKTAGDNGIININIYHPNKEQLKQIAEALNHVLKTNHAAYHGSGNSVVLKIIDKPIYSAWPTRPNLIFNSVFALFFGLLFALSYIYLFPGAGYDLKIFRKKKKQKKEEPSSPNFSQKAPANLLFEKQAREEAAPKNEAAKKSGDSLEDAISNQESNIDFESRGSMDNVFRSS